jgi:hypothetical protein
LELRRRAALEGAPLKRSNLRETLRALSDLAAKSWLPESHAVRQILAAMLRAHSDLESQGRALDSLTPKTVLRLDAVLDALLEGGINANELRAALRHALIRPVN